MFVRKRQVKSQEHIFIRYLNLPTSILTSTFKSLSTESGIVIDAALTDLEFTLTTHSIIPVLDFSLQLAFWLAEEVSLLLLVIVGTWKLGTSFNKSLIFVSMILVMARPSYLVDGPTNTDSCQ